ncbi:CCHC-type domain-containing protein [Trichonephila clavipes]|nr:CCHC-type domain-containing protein [Trichonephila clavipes]
MPTEQEAKPAVVTPSLQQWRSPSTFRGAPGEDPLKWLKEYDRVANFNKWDDMMCLANVYFFLDGTARQWREYTVLHTRCIRTLPRGKSSDERRRNSVTPNERLPNVVPVASLTDETDLVSLIRTIVREEVHRLVNQTQESLDSDPQSLEEIVQDEVERVLAPVSTKPTETRPRPTYAAVTRKYRAPVQKFPPEPRKTDVWRTADTRPVCFHCGRPGHVMRYCREKGCL